MIVPFDYVHTEHEPSSCFRTVRPRCAHGAVKNPPPRPFGFQNPNGDNDSVWNYKFSNTCSTNFQSPPDAFWTHPERIEGAPRAEKCTESPRASRIGVNIHGCLFSAFFFHLTADIYYIYELLKFNCKKNIFNDALFEDEREQKTTHWVVPKIYPVFATTPFSYH